MSLQDKHLQQAIKNAPDRDMVPNESTRAAVLTYANKAVEGRHKTWMIRISNLLREWLGASWHMAGVGSAVATVLVVVVFWHVLPDDTMRQVATPSEETEISVTDSAMERVPDAVPADKPLNRASSGAVAEVQESSATIVENKAAIDEKLGKAKSASPVAPADREMLAAEKSALKNSGLAEAVPSATTPVAIESDISFAATPAPVTQDKAVVASAPAVAANPPEALSTAMKG